MVSKTTIFLVGALVIIVLSTYFVFKVFYRPPSFYECLKIKNLSEEDRAIFYTTYLTTPDKLRSDCISEVAVIYGEKTFCDELPSVEANNCRNAVDTTPRRKTWELKENKTIEERLNPNYQSQAEVCANSDFSTISVRVYKDYFPRGEGIYYSFDVFHQGCLDMLKAADEDILCNTASNQDDCKFLVKFAKAPNATAACTNAISGQCELQYATSHNDPSACDDAKTHKGFCYFVMALETNQSDFCAQSAMPEVCWLYFALKQSDSVFCNKIKDGIFEHYCNSLMLAEKGS